MVLPDVNVLVYAFRRDAADHGAYRGWVDEIVASHSAFAVSDLVLSGVVRILTHPRIYATPESTAEAVDWVRTLRSQPNSVVVAPGARHWEIFGDLCERVEAKGNLVPDAYLAALAIESGSELITTDRDFSRFPGLRWRHPLHVA
jgi:toxin-antitoxin system PIN domain toxin